jgi:O-antigen/teichoic acid export membrane protein
MAIDSKRIAKNTIYMYARMILIMLVGIYTSRVVLDKLGVDDYGLYNAVASIVAMISFLNATLSTSTSRFLTYDLGKGEKQKLQDTFSTSFFTHVLLAVFVVVLMETAGLWYMHAKFVIPDGREIATNVIYHISIFTAAIAIIQVPYTASIMAHEDLSVYAYVGIFDVFARLGIVYLLKIAPIDSLIVYAFLVALVQLLVTLVYVIISRNKYEETHLVWHFNKDTFREMLGFTGWTAVANLSNTVVVQGSTVLLNLFFAPAIIASKALANQITSAVMQFVNNFRVALNPQIIKSYVAGENEEFKKLSLRSTVFTCDLLIILGFPCIVTMKAILKLWLVEVPPLAVEFTQLAIISQIISSISSSTYIPFVATGQLKQNAVWGSVASFGYFVILYLCFKNGAGAIWVQWLNLILALTLTLWMRPVLLKKEIGFSYKDVFRCFFECFKPMAVAGFLSYGLSLLFGDTIWEQLLLFIAVFVVCCCTTWLFLDKPIRAFFVNMLKSKLHKG